MFTPRKRDGEGAGKTENSWKKHEILNSAAKAQARVLRMKCGGRGLGIDMHAGDGIGVPHPQADLFRENNSPTTPQVLSQIAGDVGDMDLLFCEKSRDRRESLGYMVPGVPILKNHSMAVDHVGDHNWAIIFNDPNGHGDHGVEHIRAIADRVPFSDVFIVFNQGGHGRQMGLGPVKPSDYEQKNAAAIIASKEKKEEHKWMTVTNSNGLTVPSPDWMQRIGRKRMAFTKLIHPSRGFPYRIIVVSNYLTDQIVRNQIFEAVL